MFADAAVWLDQQRREHLSRAVRLDGADGISIVLQAGIGRSAYETTNEYGAVERWESRDYIVTRADLHRLPMPGDTIVEEQDSRQAVYEVSAPRGMPVWTPADSYGISISIHTALVEAR
jgi:hypothetical protein